jgi:3',5'-cyclic AMP phosphodiesterase CpdA
MARINIVHLSDLHFGISPEQLEIWRSLSRFINNKINPQLLLITGDIVDTVDKNLYRAAREELDRLEAVNGYRVCPGNHDRHIHGNALGRVLRKAIFWKSGNEHALFDNVFGGLVARDEDPKDLVLTSEGNRWSLRIIGFDTSMYVKYSAQGFAPLKQLESFGAALSDKKALDLVIFLQHHHLLPIAELDSLRQSMGGLFSPSIMLNAGTMLKRLAQHNINLVLHGHEHQRHVARYGTFEGRKGEVVVVGAGSATGAKTLAGCELQRASANLIELCEDRSVYLREIRHNGNDWCITNDPEILLFDSLRSAVCALTGLERIPPRRQVD